MSRLIKKGKLTINTGGRRCVVALTFLLFTFSLFTSSAATLSFSTTSAAMGTEVVLPLRVTDFNNVGVFQFSVRWNQSVLTCLGVEQFGVPGLGSASFGILNQSGALTVSWDDGDFSGESLPNGSTLFAIRFQLSGGSGASTAVSVSGSPASIEFTDPDFNEIPVTSVAGQITITQSSTAPSITTHPQSSTATVGDNVNFTVVAAGTAPLHYQWQKNGSPVAGANSVTLNLSSVQASTAGDYTVVVTNNFGSITSSVARLTVNPPPDTVDPTVAISSPTSQPTLAVTSNTLSIGGDASDNIGVTQVTWANDRGGNGTASGTTTWSVGSITLQPGVNVLTVTARDVAGNTATDTLTVTYTPADTADPTISITSPTSLPTLSVTTNIIALGGAASDNVAVTEVTWANNRGGSGTATGTDTWSVSSITLQPGTNILTATARDAAGNVATDTLTVTYTPPDMTPPVIAITSPTSNAQFSTGSPQLSLGGNASDNVAVTQVTWANDRGGSGTATGTTNWSVNGIALQPGTNILTITAHDAAARTSTDTLTVTYTPPDTSDPNITITSPTSSSSFSATTNTISLGGNASDNVGVTEVSWTNDRGGSGTATLTGSAQAPNWSVVGIRLRAGANVLVVTARDAAGNTRTDSLTVNFNPPTPEPIMLQAGTATALPGSQVVVTIRASNFIAIGVFQFSMHWSPGVANYLSVEQLGLPGLSSSSFGLTQTASGTLTVSWDDQEFTGKTLADGAVLFAIRFQLVGAAGSSTTFRIDGSPTDLEAANSDLLDVPVEVVNGLISIGGANLPPVLAAIGNKTVAEGALLTFTADASDPDEPSQTLSFSLSNAPPGAAIHPTTGVFTWTPTEADGPSTNSVTIRVTDNGEPVLSDSETINIVVSEANAPPVLAPIGNRSVNEGSLLTFNVTATDSDAPAQTLTYSLENAPPGAQLQTQNPQLAVFTWTPTEAQGPSTNFVTIRVTDSAGGSDSETVRIITTELNTAPVLDAIGDRTVAEGTLLSFTATASDADLPSQNLSFSLSGAPSGASIHPASGVFSWTPTEGQGPSTDQITIIVADNAVGSSPGPLTHSETITVTVSEQNRAPSLQFIGNKTVNEGSLLSFTAVASDPDLPAQTLSFSLPTGAPSGANLNPSTGVFTWTPNEGQGPSSNTVTILVRDNGSPSLTASETITITVNELNSAPVLASIGNKAARSDTLLTFTASASDPDVPSQTFSFSLDGTDQFGLHPLGCTIDPVTGVFRWTPSLAQSPSSNSVTIRVTDSAVPALSDFETITITVNGQNTAPALDPIADTISVAEGDTLSFRAQADDDDSPSQTLTFSLAPAPGETIPAGASIHPSTGAFTWTPTESQGPGSYNLVVRVTDNGSPPLTDSEAVVIEVLEVNSPPVLQTIGDLTITETRLFSFIASVTDEDLPAQTLTYTLDDVPTGLSINPTNGLLTWIPSETQGPGTYPLTIRVTDDGSPPFSAFEDFSIIVLESNAPPVLTPIGNKAVIEGNLLTFTAVASDSDVPSQTVSFSLSNAPSGASIQPSTGVFTWTPTEAQGPSTNNITIRVTDNGSPQRTVTETISVIVSENNAAPTLTSIGNKTVTEGSLLTFTAAASDPDLPAQGLSFSLSNAPAGASIHPVTGVFTWNTSEADGPSTSTVTVRVTDNGTLPRSDSETISITVSEINSAPLLTPIGDKVIRANSVLSFTVAASDTDIPAQSLTFTMENAPSGATINPTTGAFSWRPTLAQAPSTNTVLIRVTDSASPPASAFEIINIRVLLVNSTPVLGAIGNKSVNENQLLTFTATATDADEPAQPLTFTLQSAGALPAGASIHPSTGVFNWTPTEAQGPSTNVITIQVADDGVPPLTDSETITIVVNELNSGPILQPIAPTLPGGGIITEGQLLTFVATAADPDFPPQTLSFSLLNAPAGASINTSNGVFTWIPSEAQGPGTNTFTIRVTESAPPQGSAQTDSETITIVVAEANAPPLLNPIGNKSVTEGSLLTFTVRANDSDIPTQTVMYSLDSPIPAGASIHPVTGVFTWTPTDAQGPSTNTITIRATDSGSVSDFESISVVVNEANTAPVLGVVGNKTVNEGATLTFTVSATDSDVPSQSLTYTIEGAPAGATINPTTGFFSWTPTEAQGPSTNTIIIRVTDNPGPASTGPLNDAETITITVNEVNSTPVLAAIGNRSVVEASLLTFTASVTDTDLPAQTLTFSLGPGAPAGASIHPTTGVFSWTPTEAQGPSTNSITIRVTESGAAGLSDSETFMVFVSETNAVPVITPIGDRTATEGIQLSFTVRATDPDVPGQTITYSLEFPNPNPNLNLNPPSIDPTTGVFTWTPAENQGPSTNTVTIRVTDSAMPPASDFETITLIVLESNGPPIISLNQPSPLNHQEGTPLSFTVGATDSDVPAQSFTFSLDGTDQSGVHPLGCSIHPTTGLFTWTPTETHGPSTNAIAIRVTDNGSPPASAVSILTVVVTEVNTGPTLIRIGNKAVAERNLLTFTVFARDTDLPSNPLTFSLQQAGQEPIPSGASIHPTTGVFTWTPTEAQGPSTNFIAVRVCDTPHPSAINTDPLCANETITIIVTDRNLPPVLTPIGNLTIDERSPFTFTASASDPDIPAQGLAFSLESAAGQPVPSGAAIHPTTGVFSWTPTEGQGPSTNSVIIRVTDNGPVPLDDFEAISLIVREVNTPPELFAIGDKVVPEGTLLTFRADAIDDDLPAQSLTFSLGPGAPAGAAINSQDGTFTWTPLETQGPSTNSITIRVTDSGGGSIQGPLTFTETIMVTVLETNNAPVLNAIGDKTITEGQPLTFTVAATDSDLPPQALTFSVNFPPNLNVNPPSINPSTGLFTWTPTEAQGPGTNRVTIRVCDAGLCATETIEIVVNETNSRPTLTVATDHTIPEGMLLTFDVVGDDADIPGQTLLFQLDGADQAGDHPLGASLNPVTGLFTWTPAETQGPGTNSFTIRIADDGTPALSNSVRITVVVTEANTPPLLSGIGQRTVAEGTQLTFTAGAIDGDLPSQSLTFSVSNAPAGASIHPTTGVFTWTPAEGQGPSTNFITVRVTDSGVNTPQGALSDSETVMIVVNESNIAPTLANVGNKTINEGALLTFTVTASDADLPSQTLSFSLVNAPLGATINPTTGVFTWMPFEEDGPSTNAVTIRVSDNAVGSVQGPLTDSETINIVVNEVNSAPELTAIGNKTIAEGGLLSFQVIADDTDMPPQPLSFSLLNAPAGASINPNTGLFTWTPTETQGPSSNSVTIRVTDDPGGPGALSHSETITITVLETNNAPTLVPIGNKTNSEGSALNFTVLATDSDLPAQTLSFSLSNAPAGAIIDPTTGAFSWTPAEQDGPGTRMFRIRVTDSGTPPLSSTELITVTVTEVNSAPLLILQTNSYTVPEATVLSFTAIGMDSDVPGQTLSFSLSNAPPGASIHPTTGVFTWLPSELQGPSTNSFFIRVTDNGSNTPQGPLSASLALTVVVAEVNTAPTVAPIQPQSVSEGALLTFTPVATDVDVPAQRLRFSLEGTAPIGASINSSNGLFTWIPDESQGPSTNNITIRVIDSGAPPLSGFVTVTLIVTDPNIAPELDPIGNKSVTEGQLLTFTATAADSDIPAQSLSFSLSGAPSGASIHPVTGVFTWTPSESQGPGSHSITIRVTDNGSPAATDSETILVTVGETNSAPVLAAITDRAVGEGTLLSFTASVSDPDVPAQNFTFSLEGTDESGLHPLGYSINPTTGLFSWTPSETQGPSTNSITIHVADNGSPSLTDSATFEIIVTESNSAPVLTDMPTITVIEDELLTLTLTATDTDLPVQRLRFSLEGTVPAGASINTTNGVFTWRPTEAQGPSTNNVTVRVIDSGTPPLSDVTTIRIVVTESNTPPVLAAIGNKAGRHGQLLTFTAFATDSDVPSPSLSFSLSNAPAGAFIHQVTGVFTWTPNQNQAPSTNFVTIRVTDSGGTSDSETIIITVNGLNSPPSLNVIANKTAPEGGLLTFTNVATDPDPGQTLIFTLAGPSGAAIDPLTGVFTWTPSEAQGPGTYPVVIAVADNGSPPLTDSKLFSIQVTEINSPPVLDFISDKNAAERMLLSFTATGSDPDIPAQALTFSLRNAPSGASIDSVTGVFSWTPSSSQSPDTYRVGIRVADSAGLSVTQFFNIFVTDNPADLQIGIVASPEFVSLGESILYQISVLNRGPGTAVGVILTNTLPAEVEIESTSIPALSSEPTQLIFNLGNLPADSVTNISVLVNALSAGEVTAMAEVNSLTPELNTADNLAAVTATIDTMPALYISDSFITEVNRGSTDLVFEVVLSAPSDRTVNVTYTTARNTAAKKRDFTHKTGVLKFAPGVTRKLLRIPVMGDTLSESNETFFVNLSRPVNAILRRTQGLGTIMNNDRDPSLSVSSAKVVEPNTGAVNAVFKIKLSRPSGQTVLVDFATPESTATAGLDYTPTNGTLIFLPGVTNKTIRVPVLGDRINEPKETFLFHLSNPVNATILDGEGVGSILNNDPLPSLSISDVVVTEASGTNALFFIRLSAPSGVTISVHCATANGSARGSTPAQAGLDYITIAGDLVFQAGVTNLAVAVPIIDDQLGESAEVFTLNLSGAVGATIADTKGAATIQDNDTAVAAALLPAMMEAQPSHELRIVSAVLVTDEVEITFTTLPGRTHILEYTSELSGDWRPASDPVEGTGGSITLKYLANPAQPHCFYRVRVLD